MSQDRIETPEEMYVKIAKWLESNPHQFGALDVRDMWWLIKHYRDQVAELAEYIAGILAEAHVNIGHVGSGTSQCSDKIRKESLERILTHCEQSLSVFVADKWRE